MYSYIYCQICTCIYKQVAKIVISSQYPHAILFTKGFTVNTMDGRERVVRCCYCPITCRKCAFSLFSLTTFSSV